MSRVMLCAMESGSGKTVITCGLLQALKTRGLAVRAFKCGPEYIDPMFHKRVLCVESHNLDLFLQGETGVIDTLRMHQGTVSVLEGAMGFYDGIGGTDAASAWQIASVTQTPVVLIVRPSGASLTLAAQIKGMMAFRADSKIAGILLNACAPSLAAYLTPILQRETGLRVFGYLPMMPQAALESRHLGLLTADEVNGFTDKFMQIAAQMEQTIDIDALLRLAQTAPEIAKKPLLALPKIRCRIAVARDAAFGFYYENTWETLRQAGAELCFFSPLHDTALPPHTNGLYLGGGYPEIYAKTLSKNNILRAALKQAIAQGLPTVAECGGFLYLQQTLQDENGVSYPMVGALMGDGIKTQRLQRFGYVTLTAKTDSLLFRAGECAPAHEFHYWDCTQNGDSFVAQKPTQDKIAHCGFAAKRLYAAFPHLHFGGALPFAQRFVASAIQSMNEEDEQDG